jgi:AraC family transcriptional regulator
MSLAARIVWAIERHIDRPLSLSALAETCNVSRFHLAHAFSAATGQSVIAYLRGRRLTQAARALAAGAGDILALALDCGYGSNEAFSRAFRDQFGATPEAVRKAGSTEGLALIEPLDGAEFSIARIPPPRIAAAQAMTFVGSTEAHLIGRTAGIPGQWQRFMPRYGEIEGKVDPSPWGLSMPSQIEGGFDYMCAVKVSGGQVAPRGLRLLKLGPRPWAVFEHRGHVSRMPATFAAIWNDWPAELCMAPDAPCLEQHCPAFDPRTGLGGVDIWIPLAVQA